MIFNVLVNQSAYVNSSVASCVVYGLEVADTAQTAAALTSRPTLQYGSDVFQYVQANVVPTAVADISAMLNNFDQFVYVKSTSALMASANYNPTRNRHIADLDGRYPYACNNLQVNVAGMATTSGGIIRIGDGIYGDVID